MPRAFRNKRKKNFDLKSGTKNVGNLQERKQVAYADIVKENSNFENYYKTQGIVPEEEWGIFLKKNKEDLPISFRITGSKAEKTALVRIVNTDLFLDIIGLKCTNDNINSEREIRPLCLPFYPDQLAWELHLSRKDIRRSEIYCKLHNFLITETNSGNISRQEVVSMIPPLLLDVKPHHKVLDMCASPGSKTAQIIEMIHADENDPFPEGFVIANDVDNSRCYMLVHQAKRLNSPNILITNHDASTMPNFLVTNGDGVQDVLKFDRVLADVPCSGDGTMRKNPDIWGKWNVANGNNLHGIQYRIAKRGVEMLKIGGKMVYSTCSLNPIENEAVIFRLLSEAKGSLKLVECSNILPGLVSSTGLSSWKPASKDFQYFTSYDDVPEHLRSQIHPKMFPPNLKDANEYNLEKCLRILPHHQNTGGFFLAVLEKLNYLPWESSTTDTKACDQHSNQYIEPDRKNSESGQRKRKRLRIYREDPFVFFKKDEDVWQSIKEFYAINDSLNPESLLVRCKEGKKRNIYLVSSTLQDIVQLNSSRIKMVNTGVKTFVRCDNKDAICSFRLSQEGLHNIVNIMSDKRKVLLNKQELIMLLQNHCSSVPPEILKLSEETQKQLKDFDVGSCVIMYNDNEINSELELKLVGWKGRMSLRAYVSEHDALHFLRLLNADVSMFEKKTEQMRSDNR